jgi:predicted transcriptional regulator
MRPKKINDEKLMEMVEQGIPQKDIAEYFKVSPASVCKRLKRLKPPPDLSGLTDKQRDFVVNVARGKNPTAVVSRVYDCKKESAKSMASVMMNDEGLITHIAKLLEYYGLSRGYRVRRLKHWVDNPDGNLSLKALEQSWRLDGYIEKSLNVDINIREVDAEIARLTKELEELRRSDSEEDIPEDIAIEAEITE